jgi:hypothetical protein
MAPNSDMSTPEMTRITVRVPKATLDQINQWVDLLGVRRSHFLGIALVAGARSLIRASALELSLHPAGEAAAEGAEEGVEAELGHLRAEVALLREQLDRLLPSSEGAGPSSGS